MIIVEIAGHLGSDPEVRFTPNNQKVTTFRMGVNSRKGGETKTMWWRVTVWGDRFDKMMAYVKKGSALIVVGEMNEPQIYTDKEGRPQCSLELTAEMLRFSPFGKGDKESTGGDSRSNSYQTPAAPSYSQGASKGTAMDLSESEIEEFSEEGIPF